MIGRRGLGCRLREAHGDCGGFRGGHRREYKLADWAEERIGLQ